jgi:hypothetical protein
MSRSSKWFIFLHQIPLYISFLRPIYHRPLTLHPLWFYHPNDIRWDIQSMMCIVILSIFLLLPPCLSQISSWPPYSWNTFSLRSFPNMGGKVSHLYKPQVKFSCVYFYVCVLIANGQKEYPHDDPQ